MMMIMIQICLRRTRHYLLVELTVHPHSIQTAKVILILKWIFKFSH